MEKTLNFIYYMERIFTFDERIINKIEIRKNKSRNSLIFRVYAFIKNLNLFFNDLYDFFWMRKYCDTFHIS